MDERSKVLVPRRGQLVDKGVFKITSSSFFRNLLTVMSGTAAAQAIGFALIPVISRLFSPADFGVFGAFTAVVFVVGCGVTLDYTQALMLPKRREDAFCLLVASCASIGVITVVCLFACLVFPSILQGLIKSTNPLLVVLFVLAVFFSGLVQVGQAWCTRIKDYKQFSGSLVTRSLSANGVQVGLGVLVGGPLVLVFSSVIGDALASLRVWKACFRDFGELVRQVRWCRVLAVAKEYADFPMYSATQNVLSAVSQGLPVLILTYFHGVGVGGAYAFGMRMIQIPMGFILRSLRNVFFQKACETKSKCGLLFPLFAKTTFGLFGIALLPAMLLTIWAPELFEWIFGAKWYVAGEYVQITSAWMLVFFCNTPAVLMARIIRIQRAMLLFDIVLVGITSLALVYGGSHLTAYQTVILLALVGGAANAVRIGFIANAVLKGEGGNWFAILRRVWYGCGQGGSSRTDKRKGASTLERRRLYGDDLD